MALTNWDLLTIANVAINRDVEGRAVKSDEFQSLLNAKSQLLFSRELGFDGEFPLDAPLSRRGAGKSRVISQKLRPFFKSETKTISGGTFSFTNLANSVAYVLAINPSTISGRGFDELEPDEYSDRIGSSVVAPTADDPIFKWTGKNSILINPSSITQITVDYYKYPADAVITTTQNSTTLLEEYVSGSSTELEWYDPEKVYLVYEILRDLGVNIKMQDVTALGERITQNG